MRSVSVFFVFAIACGGSSPPVTIPQQPSTAGDVDLASSAGLDGGAHADLSHASSDGSIGPLLDASSSPDLSGMTSSGDGTPMRVACTSAFSTGITAGAFGRLDGYLVAIVQPSGSKTCGTDANHFHLQVLVNGKVHDVAANLNDSTGAGDVQYLATDINVMNGTWSEGWHTNESLNYTSLGVHSTEFTGYAESALAAHVTSDVQNANHISIFGTGYTDTTGVHDIHRYTSGSGGTDGAIVLNPLSSTQHALLFHFANQSF